MFSRKWLLAGALMAVLPCAAAGQNVTASGTVNKAAAWGDATALTFGSITPTATGQANLVVNAWQGTADAGKQAGSIDLWFNGSGVTVSVTSSTLARAGGEETLAPTIACGHTATSATPAAQADLTGYSATCALTMNLTGSTAQTRRIWLGGTISGAALSAAVAGTYEGNIVLTYALN